MQEISFLFHSILHPSAPERCKPLRCNFFVRKRLSTREQGDQPGANGQSPRRDGVPDGFARSRTAYRPLRRVRGVTREASENPGAGRSAGRFTSPPHIRSAPPLKGRLLCGRSQIAPTRVVETPAFLWDATTPARHVQADNIRPCGPTENPRHLCRGGSCPLPQYLPPHPSRLRRATFPPGGRFFSIGRGRALTGPQYGVDRNLLHLCGA